MADELIPRPANHPMSKERMRTDMLRLAGFTPELAAEYMRKALNTLDAGLSATKTQYFSRDGEVVDERTDIDTPNRIKSAIALVDINTTIHHLDKVGALNTDGETKGNITLVMNFGDGAQATLNVLGSTGEVSTDVKNPTPEEHVSRVSRPDEISN